MANQGYYGGLQNWMDAMSDSIVTARQKKLDAQSAIQQEMQMKLQQAQLDKYNQDLASEKALKEAIARAAELQRAPATDTMPGSLPPYASGVPTAVQRPFAPINPMTQDYLSGLIQQEIGGMAPQPNMPFPAQDVSPLIQAYAQGRRPAGSTVVRQPTGKEIIDDPSVQAAMLANDPKSYLSYMREANKVDPVTMLLLRDMLGGEQKNMLEDRKDTRQEKLFAQQEELQSKRLKQQEELADKRMGALLARMGQSQGQTYDRQTRTIFSQLQRELRNNPTIIQAEDSGMRLQQMEAALRQGRASGNYAGSDQALGYFINKVFDPNSVVMPSEFARVAETQGLPSKIVGSIIKNGGNMGGIALTEANRNALVATAKELNNIWQQRKGQKLEQYRNSAASQGLDPDALLAGGSANAASPGVRKPQQSKSGTSRGGKPSLDSFFK